MDLIINKLYTGRFIRAPGKKGCSFDAAIYPDLVDSRSTLYE